MTLKRLIRRGLRRIGYDILKVPRPRPSLPLPEPPPVTPVWPLPKHAPAPSDDAIREAFARYPHWQYPFEFEGGLSFRTSHTNPGLDTDDPRRPFQVFRHFMPYLVQALGGTLEGKRILDIACNSGFWSLQCALLGASVVGFDARPELIEQAELVKRLTGVRNVEFQVLDFREMSREALGGPFDAVLNIGLLYHLPKPLEALEKTIAMARSHVLLDTALYPSEEPVIYLKWEEPFDIRTAVEEGMVAVPTRTSVELMLRHLNVRSWFEVPVRTTDLHLEYRTHRRASWLITV